MERTIEQFVQADSQKFPQGPPKFFSYGTAGFRDRAEMLDCVIFRSALISTLRSKSARATIGIVLTASHNPEQDNGIKFVDVHGEMLIPEWEAIASRLGNARSGSLLESTLSVVKEWGLDSSDYQPNVVVAKDTRPSGDHLKQLLFEGLALLQTKYIDYGLLTTPQLHFMVKCTNSGGKYGEPSEDGYCQKLAKAFTALMPQDNGTKPLLKLDAANGVGAGRVKKLLEYIGDLVDIKVYNDGTNGRLNHLCGADYVKTNQRPPHNIPMFPNHTCVSFDGDADRIVFFYLNEETNNFKLLDGDKIACLMALFVKETLEKMDVQLEMSVIQTAYANGSSTKYLTDVLGVPVTCTKTGVKHLQRKAQEFDIGIFFEANGHGTILYSEKTLEAIQRSVEDNSVSSEGLEAAQMLRHFVDLTNETTGDSIADMIMVQCILSNKKWKCSQWDKIYRELPNKQMTVKVLDRSVITTADVERRCVTPPGLQEAINELVSKVPSGRSFVRPSGTEDIVRVYAEAETQELADKLAENVSEKVFELAGGIGNPPTLH